jgi:hypothetical protein
MDITKLRLLKQKNGNGLEISYEKPGASGDKVGVPSETHTAIVHNDLYNAIQALAPHLAIMAFHVKETDVEDIAMPDKALFDAFSVGSYNISGKEDKRGIIISGTLRKHGKAHNFNTPFYRFEEPPQAKYAYMEDLEAKLRVIESLVPGYLDGTQRGEPAQPELGMPEKKEKVTKLQIAEPDPHVKVTAEGNLAPESSKHKFANKDAMERVGKMGTDGEGEKKKPGGKRVKQSADHPSGIIPEENQEESPI